MDVFFVENCELCNCSENIREYEYFYDGEQTENEENAVFITSKETAKKFFESCGWKYHKDVTFCSKCFSKLKRSYVVVDKFNCMYNETFSYDIPKVECLLPNDRANKLIEENCDIKILVKKKALPFVTALIKEEIECDFIGFFRTNTNVPLIISDFTAGLE